MQKLIIYHTVPVKAESGLFGELANTYSHTYVAENFEISLHNKSVKFQDEDRTIKWIRLADSDFVICEDVV
jgi:hypothetical protein